MPRNEADEEDKARYKLDTEAQIKSADFKISFPITKRGKDYTRALLIRHGYAAPPSPLGPAFLVALLTLPSSRHPERNGEMFLQNSVQHNKPPWSRTFLRAGQPQKSVSVKRTGSPNRDGILFRKYGQ